MTDLNRLKNKVLSGEDICKTDALSLLDAPTDELCAAADEIREKLCGRSFDACAIVNGKSGKCGEDCRFCAQSARHSVSLTEYPLMSSDELVRAAENSAKDGVPRFSIVTSGRRLSDAETDGLCESVRLIKERVPVSVCASVGLCDKKTFAKLRESGVDRAHCNLETSERFFPQICSTHTFGDKIAAIEDAKSVGLEVCSGGIMGLGETQNDRIDMAFTLRELEISSVPVNFLNPIKGTPLWGNAPLSDEEKRRIIAVYRFILPRARIRLAGGRKLIADKGEACFKSGANAAITGDMLTTAGISARTDSEMIERLGFLPFARRS